jgi:IS30 family transposase
MTVSLCREHIHERRDRVATLTRAGQTALQIADELGVTPRTVQRIRSVVGIAKPKPPPLADDEKRIARVLLDDGASITEAARTIGRSQRALRDAFPGRGWTQQQSGAYSHIMRRFQEVLA